MAREPAGIAAWIAAKDAKSLQQLPEIGKRLAETIVAELNGKVDGWLSAEELTGLSAASIEPAARPPLIEEAIETLLALGESRSDAERMIDRALAGGESFDSPDAVVAAAFGVRASA